MTDSQQNHTPGRASDDFGVVDVYICYNPVEAQLIRDILADNGIDSFARPLQPSQFPLNVGKHGQIRITVVRENAASARSILQEAITEGALSGDGSFGDELS